MVSALLVFDLDGTLVDSAPDLLGTLKAVLPKHGVGVEIDATYRQGIGNGARYLIEYALLRQGIVVDQPALDAIYRDFLDHYEANITVETRPFAGTDRLLDRFAEAGWSLAVCTNKPARMSRLLLENLGIAGRFAAICGGDSFAHRKPHPEHLLQTTAAAGGVRERVILVGDSQTDLDTARGAGVPFVGVSFGYTPIPMRELSPDLLIDSFDELTPEQASLLLERSVALLLLGASIPAATA
jgi:phosphoglycolate phosphatase